MKILQQVKKYCGKEEKSLLRNIFDIALNSRVQLYINLWNVVIWIIISSLLQIWYVEVRISWSMKYFREYLGIRDNESWLYMFVCFLQNTSSKLQLQVQKMKEQCFSIMKLVLMAWWRGWRPLLKWENIIKIEMTSSFINMLISGRSQKGLDHRMVQILLMSDLFWWVWLFFTYACV